MISAAERRARTEERIAFHLRIAESLLVCADAEEPGPDRLECLYCAGHRLTAAETAAERAKIPLPPLLDELWTRYQLLAAEAGEGEVVFDAFDGRVLVVTRESGKWRERHESVH